MCDKELEYKFLSINDINDIINLQNKVVEKLITENKEKYLYKRSKEDYEDILNKNGLILGAYSKNKLVGFTIINNTHKEFPYYFNGNTIQHTENFVIIEGVMVYPDVKGIGHNIIGKACEKAKEMNYDCAYSVICSENVASLLACCKNDFYIINSFNDPDDQAPIHLMFYDLKNQYKKINHNFVHQNYLQISKIDEFNNFDYIKSLNDKGYSLKYVKDQNKIYLINSQLNICDDLNIQNQENIYDSLSKDLDLIVNIPLQMVE